MAGFFRVNSSSVIVFFGVDDDDDENLRAAEAAEKCYLSPTSAWCLSSLNVNRLPSVHVQRPRSD
jgi:hypothetical protein